MFLDKKIYVLILTVLLSGLVFTGCASNKSKARKHAVSQVTLLNKADNKVCDVINQCRYIQDLRCKTRSSPEKISRCEADLRKYAASAGADTFVLQLSATNKRNETNIAFGQAYDCSAVNTEYAKGKSIGVSSFRAVSGNKYPVRMYNIETIEKCGLPSSCTFISDMGCPTGRKNKVIRCVNKLHKQVLNNSGNALVISENFYYRDFKKYKIGGKAYNCTR